MLEKEPKTKKSLMIFGFLITVSGIAGVFLFLLSLKMSELQDMAMWAFAIMSVFGVAFQVYYKEFKIGQANWMNIPFSFRFVWWFIFVMNSFNFMNQALTTFVFG